MPRRDACQQCGGDLPPLPIDARAVNPETGRTVERRVCGRACASMFKAALAELEPPAPDAPHVTVEVEYSEG